MMGVEYLTEKAKQLLQSDYKKRVIILFSIQDSQYYKQLSVHSSREQHPCFRIKPSVDNVTMVNL